ncbi:MAG: Radical SAM domain protein [uncultured Chloroflexi bacterium]|uniref:Radical SAM domain protein n=1 Tax=uncultured Chloroflexota bacterium TaxID=166587 RepID=A0A6J4I480_9CHLR|nr:MAG: Radical SAM domain protein [uncultured Chloroflexota bacterium]
MEHEFYSGCMGMAEREVPPGQPWPARPRVSEVRCKTALNRVRGMPFAWSLNPYRGCAHAWGYYLMRDWAKARAEIDPLFTEARAGRMAVPKFAQKAQEITERVAAF